MTPEVASKIMASFSASSTLSLSDFLSLAVIGDSGQHQDIMAAGIRDKIN